MFPCFFLSSAPRLLVGILACIPLRPSAFWHLFPRQVCNGDWRDVGPPTDAWSLGCVAFAAFDGGLRSHDDLARAARLPGGWGQAIKKLSQARLRPAPVGLHGG